MGQNPPEQEPPAGPPAQPPPGGAEPSPASGGGASYVAASGAGLRATEWWKRLVAAIIDSAILFVVYWILALVGVTALFVGGTTTERDPITGQEFQVPRTGFVAGLFAIVILLAILTALYQIILHGMRGQTVGKMVMKIKVVDQASGADISYGTAFIRWLVQGLAGSVSCGIFALLDGLWPLWDPMGQALHDKVAKTLVIDV